MKVVCDYCSKKKRWWHKNWILGGQAGYYDFCCNLHERYFKQDELERNIR